MEIEFTDKQESHVKEDFRKWIVKNREKLQKNAIPINSLEPDDEWANDNEWDVIYSKTSE